MKTEPVDGRLPRSGTPSKAMTRTSFVVFRALRLLGLVLSFVRIEGLRAVQPFLSGFQELLGFDERFWHLRASGMSYLQNVGHSRHWVSVLIVLVRHRESHKIITTTTA